MKIYIAAYQSKAYDIQNKNIMIKKISNRLGEELEDNLIFLREIDPHSKTDISLRCWNK